jgi:hypothetical protein
MAQDIAYKMRERKSLQASQASQALLNMNLVDAVQQNNSSLVCMFWHVSYMGGGGDEATYFRD